MEGGRSRPHLGQKTIPKNARVRTTVLLPGISKTLIVPPSKRMKIPRRSRVIPESADRSGAAQSSGGILTQDFALGPVGRTSVRSGSLVCENRVGIRARPPSKKRPEKWTRSTVQETEYGSDVLM